MAKKILYVYKWATMGGVERVFLNRALAFKAAGADVSQDVFFLHDSGGKKLLNEYIEKHELGQYLQIVNEFAPEKYDSIHPVDTPEIFGMMENHEKILFECHTAYEENRHFLREIPLNIKGIVVPSAKFKEEILEEIPVEMQGSTHVLGNFVPESMYNSVEDYKEKFNKIPISYIGRVDKLKNVEEVIEIFVRLQKTVGDKFLLIVAGPLTPEVNLQKLVEEKGILNRFIYLPAISFAKIPHLLKIIKKNDGIVVSASKGESFGLAIAEAIVCGIPVVASHIHSHLVDGNEKFLYRLNNIEEAVDKIKFIVNNNELCLQAISSYKNKLTDEIFLEDWRYLCTDKVDIT